MSYKGYARIREDVTRSDWCFRSRSWTDENGLVSRCSRQALAGITLPEACRYRGGPGNFKLNAAYQKWFYDLNVPHSDDAVKYINKIGSGWRNQGGDWQVEQVSFAGNVVKVTNENLLGDKAFIETVDITQPPPALNFVEHPHLIQCFTAVEPDGDTVLPWIGPDKDHKYDAQVLLFLVTDRTWLGQPRQLYIYKRDLEYFPLLPLSVNVIVGGLNVRSSPGGLRVKNADGTYKVLSYGTPLTIEEYVCRANFVWGKIGFGEWVALQAPTVNDFFTTTWRMETPAPPAV